VSRETDEKDWKAAIDRAAKKLVRALNDGDDEEADEQRVKLIENCIGYVGAMSDED